MMRILLHLSSGSQAGERDNLTYNMMNLRDDESKGSQDDLTIQLCNVTKI